MSLIFLDKRAIKGTSHENGTMHLRQSSHENNAIWELDPYKPK